MDIFTVLKAFRAANLLTETEDISLQFVSYCRRLMDDCGVQITFGGYTEEFDGKSLDFKDVNFTDDLVDAFLAYCVDDNVDMFMRFVNDYLDDVFDYQLTPLFARFYPRHFDEWHYEDFYSRCMKQPAIQKLKVEIDAKRELEAKNDLVAELLDTKNRLAELETKLDNYKDFETEINKVIIENANLKRELARKAGSGV